MEPDFHEPQPEHAPACPDTLDLFNAPPVNVPDIRTPAPSAPGSDTSQAAADYMTHSPLRARSHRVIMLCLATLPRYECFSMEELSERTGIRIASLCARLDDLCPTWIEKVKGARQSSALRSLRVNGYRLTEAGRDRLKGAA
jgi:hypothetical protein